MPFLTFVFKSPLEAFQINGFGEELSKRLQNVQEDLEFCHFVMVLLKTLLELVFTP